MMIFYFLVVAASFLVSSTVGLGGSLIAVPAMIAFFGPKSGVAIAAILLASNNIFKIIAYRRTIPWKSASILSAITMVGAFIGAHLLLSIPDIWVVIAVMIGLTWSLVTEGLSNISTSWSPNLSTKKPWLAGVYALASGLTSGVSGTSGPLKGLAIRQFTLNRQHYVGAASLVSFVGDITKASVFAEASLLGQRDLQLLLLVIPLMPLCTFVGRWLNYKGGERWFSYMFWAVMIGYALRLAVRIG